MFNFNQKRGRGAKKNKNEEQPPKQKEFKSPSSGQKKGKKNKKAKVAAKAPDSPSSNNSKKVYDPKYFEEPETRDSYGECQNQAGEKPLTVSEIMDSSKAPAKPLSVSSEAQLLRDLEEQDLKESDGLGLDKLDDTDIRQMLSMSHETSDEKKKEKQVNFKISVKRNLKEVENRDEEQILALISQSNKVTQSLPSNGFNSGPSEQREQKPSQASSASQILEQKISQRSNPFDKIDDLSIDFSQIALQVNQKVQKLKVQNNQDENLKDRRQSSFFGYCEEEQSTKEKSALPTFGGFKNQVTPEPRRKTKNKLNIFGLGAEKPFGKEESAAWNSNSTPGFGAFEEKKEPAENISFRVAKDGRPADFEQPFIPPSHQESCQSRTVDEIAHDSDSQSYLPMSQNTQNQMDDISAIYAFIDKAEQQMNHRLKVTAQKIDCFAPAIDGLVEKVEQRLRARRWGKMETQNDLLQEFLQISTHMLETNQQMKEAIINQ